MEWGRGEGITRNETLLDTRQIDRINFSRRRLETDAWSFLIEEPTVFGYDEMTIKRSRRVVPGSVLMD